MKKLKIYSGKKNFYFRKNCTYWKGLIGLIVVMLTIISCTNETMGDDFSNENDISNETLKNEILSRKPLSTWKDQVKYLDQKMRRFHNFAVSQEQGYFVVAGPYVPHMGFHYLNPMLVDNTFDLEHPEILLYVPDENGKMQFVGVEYLIPVADFNNPQPAPEGFIGDEDHWHLNPNAGGWTLHAWVGLQNPDGIFAGFNPLVPASID